MSKSHCIVCGCSPLVNVYQSSRSPAHIGVVHFTREAALKAKMGQILLEYCSHCHLIQNRDPERQHLKFEPGFEVQLVHSPIFRKFLDKTAQRLVTDHHLQGKDILDAGCGAGDFLQRLCRFGKNRGLGIDPAVSNEGAVPLDAGEMRLLRGDFSVWPVDESFDFAVTQSVLELVPDPLRFLRKLRRVVAERRGRLYIETFNGAHALQAGETWSICYELCNYFVLDTLVYATELAGLRVLSSGYCYGNDQYIYVEAEVNESVEKNSGSRDVNQAIEHSVLSFQESHQQSLSAWHERIANLRETHKKAVVWGSGGKGISFLNAVDASDVFPVVIDINPQRQGKFIPGTGQQIVAPEWLQTHGTDYIVVSNPLYEHEIRAMVEQLGVQAEFQLV